MKNCLFESNHMFYKYFYFTGAAIYLSSNLFFLVDNCTFQVVIKKNCFNSMVRIILLTREVKMTKWAELV